MSKDEFLKIQTCVLKVNIHCDGCKHKVKKVLQKIEGVYTTKIDSEQGRVIVSGNIDANTLIKKLIKNGKHAELWGAKPNNNNNQNHLNQFKNLQISNGGKGGGGGGGSGGGGGGNNNKGQGQKGGGNNQPKGGGGGGGPQGQNPHLQQIQQQMKGFQDMKMLPQFMKDMKLPPNHGNEQNAKSVKFKLPEDEDLSDDDFDDDDYDDDEFDDEFDDEMDHAPLNKMKPVIGNGHGGPQMPNMMMQNIMNGQLPQHLKPGGGGNGGNSGGNGGGNGKKGGGGGGNVPVQSSHGGGGGSGKKGGNGNNGGGNPNQGGGAKGGKNGGGGQNGGGIGGQNKNGGGGGGGPANGNHFMTNGAKKVNDGPHGMPNMMAMNGGGNVGQHMGNMPMSQMGHMSNLPMGQMSNLAAVQGLPASAMPGGGPGYGGGGPEHMQGNPYYQQQLAAMMMNQQRANGNERFQPMMYARPPPAVNYMPPYPPYPYPPPPGERADQYAMFSDENTSSCSVM